jgi:hypothetical protein
MISDWGTHSPSCWIKKSVSTGSGVERKGKSFERASGEAAGRGACA